MKTAVFAIALLGFLAGETSPREMPLSSPPMPSSASHAIWDDAIWDALLRRHVSPTGEVDYRGFQQQADKLHAYLAQLSQNMPQGSWSRHRKLAYWINVYNAFTVKLILDHYPLESIMDLKDPWDQPIVALGGQTYSLNEVEHEIIRKRFDEPRIHFAVNCASVSCPKLLNEAYTEEKLEQQLDRQTRAYLNNSQENKLSAKAVSLSSIFDWYQEDFRGAGGVIAFINQYSSVRIQSDARITYQPYNWKLNE